MNPGIVIKEALGDFVGERVYASTFPQQPNLPTWPAIRFTLLGGEVFPDLDGSDVWETDDVRVQLDIVATQYDQMRSLVQQVILAMGALTNPPARRIAPSFETFDAETKTHRTVLEYVLHPSSSSDSPW